MLVTGAMFYMSNAWGLGGGVRPALLHVKSCYTQLNYSAECSTQQAHQDPGGSTQCSSTPGRSTRQSQQALCKYVCCGNCMLVPIEPSSFLYPRLNVY